MSLSSTEVQEVALALVHVDRGNVNTHNDLNITFIRNSIERFGFLDPLGVVPHPKKKGEWLIVEGHGRYIAAAEIGLDTVPVIVLKLNAAERQAYAIAHNQTQQISAMDTGAVAAEFDRLNVTAEDHVSLGYTQEDVLFLPSAGGGDAWSAPDGGEYQEQPQGDPANQPSGGAAIGADKSTWGGFVPTVHRSALRFASDVSYNRFVTMTTMLRGRYPTAATIAERLQLLLTDLGFTGETASADAD